MADSASGLPDDPDELTARHFELPRLDPDSPESCPHPMSEIIEYLRMEAAPDEPTEADLEFLRTASVEGAEYWIWRFTESGDEQCYVTVSRRDGQITVGYDVNYDGLTPEQFMLAESRGWV
jgi:hypothetical protein